MRRYLAILFCLISLAAGAQSSLVFHTSAVDSVLEWLDDGCKPAVAERLAHLPEMQFMEQLLKEREPSAVGFANAAKRFSANSSDDSCYVFAKAREKNHAISLLMSQIAKSGIAVGAYRRASRFFPAGAKFSDRYNVFFSPVGWKWGDAMTFKYTETDGRYLLSENGKPAIIFNAAIIADTYGNTVEKQVANLNDVLVHELFHALFADYTRANRNYAAADIKGKAMCLIQNEGIAHYLSSREMLFASYGTNEALKVHERRAFAQLADSAAVFFDASKSDEVRQTALVAGTYGKFWNKYVCITGMFMAYHIEHSLGAEALCKSIQKGPLEFVKQYKKAARKHPELPQWEID